MPEPKLTPVVSDETAPQDAPAPAEPAVEDPAPEADRIAALEQ